MSMGFASRRAATAAEFSDKAYDTNKLCHLLAEQGVDVLIPSIAGRKPLIPYDPSFRRRDP